MIRSFAIILTTGLLLSGCQTEPAVGTTPARAPAAAPAPATPAPATVAATNAPAAYTPCGGTDQPDCPTQRWMKSTLQASLRAEDYTRLESSLKELAARAPAGYEHWREMSEGGARAAAQENTALVRKACQECHDAYRSSFRQQHRALPLF